MMTSEDWSRHASAAEAAEGQSAPRTLVRGAVPAPESPPNGKATRFSKLQTVANDLRL